MRTIEHARTPKHLIKHTQTHIDTYMAPNTPMRAQLLVNLDSILGRGVVVPHEIPRQICADLPTGVRWLPRREMVSLGQIGGRALAARCGAPCALSYALRMQVYILSECPASCGVASGLSIPRVYIYVWYV